MYCMQCFLKSKCIIVEISMVKIGELLRKLRSLRNCFHILPPGALTPQGIEGAMKRDMSKHWCTLQWCASRGWVIAHENWTSWRPMYTEASKCKWCLVESLMHQKSFFISYTWVYNHVIYRFNFFLSKNMLIMVKWTTGLFLSIDNQ